MREPPDVVPGRLDRVLKAPVLQRATPRWGRPHPSAPPTSSLATVLAPMAPMGHLHRARGRAHPVTGHPSGSAPPMHAARELHSGSDFHFTHAKVPPSAR